MFKFKLKNGITGTAIPKGTMYEVEFSNGVSTKVDANLLTSILILAYGRKSKLG